MKFIIEKISDAGANFSELSYSAFMNILCKWFCKTLPVLITLLVSLLFSVSCSGDEGHVYKFLTSYAGHGQRDGQFYQPEGMAFSPDGRFLAVADTHNNRLQLFSVDSSPTATEPLKIEMIYGDLWPWDNRTQPVDSNDAYREKDYLYDRNPDYMPGHAYQHAQSRVRPGENVPIDHFNLPVGVAWLGTATILIADTGNHRIKAQKLNGEIKWILGREGWKNGYFHHPLGVDVDCAGQIYVSEPRSNYIRGLGLDFLQRQRTQGNRLQIFSADLKPSKRLGHMHHMSGRDYRQFKDITRVWVGLNGDIFLTDNGNHRVLIFENNMKKKAELIKWPGYALRYPNGIDCSLDGRLAIADTGNHKVLILDENYVIKQIIGGFGTADGRFVRPHEARFGPNGDLYVLDTGNGRIQIFRGPQSRQFPRCPQPEPEAPAPLQKLEELLPPPVLPQDSF
ncbi:MAG: NHL repeat-containing protein [Candidatus Riflebacteria bacterium]|nr:NHL repeat-containing protein [Candidatus Riflebacteria bacterium]